MKVRYCGCGKVLPAICKVKGLCNSCASRQVKKIGKPIKASKNKSASIKKFKDFVNEVWQDRILQYGGVTCEECGRELGNEPIGFCVSHILSKGARPDLYYHTSNVNILCPDHHRQWEFGAKENMRIFAKNQTIIINLKNGRAG